MQKPFTTAAIVLALAAPAYAADSMAGPKPSGAMAGPQQPSGDSMSGGMMASHDTMKAKSKTKSKMKHDGMAGGSMSGPAQPSGGGMSGGMNH